MNLPAPLPQLEEFESFLRQHFEALLPQTQVTQSQGHRILFDAIHYSLFSGGKRFRPSVGFLLGDALNLPSSAIRPWLAAIECIHTYSLTHDDLPTMDNDITRRGKPTTHVIYGEATALLAGDALLTEAFSFIAKNYLQTPAVGLSLVQILARASGFEGMVGGQALDLASDLKQLNGESIQWVHQLKTGALIQAVVEGVAVIADLSPAHYSQIKEFGALIGLAFQLKDDLIDYNPNEQDYKNLVYHLGLPATENLLQTISFKAQQKLQFLQPLSENLNKLIQYNMERKH